MQAIILAAGRGSRLGQLTDNNPKSFVTIKGKKLIDYNISILRKLGVSDINIVIGYKDEMFRELFEHEKDIHLIYNPFYELMNVLGSFYMGMDSLNEDFLYLHADTLCDFSIWEKMLKAEGDIILPYDSKECDDEAMKIRMENNRAVEINKTMDNHLASGEFLGVARISGSVLESLREKTVELLREKKYHEYFEAVLQKLMDERKYRICALPVGDSFWAEIDFMEDYERAAANIPQELVML